MSAQVQSRLEAGPAMLAGDVAPFCLLRIAALPYAMLEDLRVPVTERRVADIVAAEAEMAAERSVEDAIHALVPQLDAQDVRLRRVALELKRAVHNARPSKLKDADFDALAQLLSATSAAQLRRWQCAQQRLVTARAQLEAGLREEIQQRLRPALRAPLKVGRFRRALAFAAAGVARGAAREKRLPNPPRPDNLERSLLGYLGRAAAKTSPFSSFMSLSVVGVEPYADAPHPYATDARYLSRTRLNRGIFSRLYRASVYEAARAGDFLLELNPSFAPSIGGRVQALCDREIVLLGRPWLEQRLAYFRFDARIIAALDCRPTSDSYDGWCARLCVAGIPAAQAADVVAKLLQRGVLLPPPVFDAFDETPEGTLARRWAQSRSPQLRGRVALLDQMAAAARGIAEAEGESRIHAFDTVRAHESALLEALGARDVEPLQNMVLEDCWLSGVRGRLGAKLLQPLADLQRFLSSQVIVSPYYERLRQHFLSEFGSDGECRDLVDFLLRVGDKLIDIPEFGAKLQEPATVRAPAGTTIPVTAQIQIAAGPDLPRALAIVNRVFDGAGWLAARYSAGDQAEQGLLREKLAQWLRRVAHPREPVDLVFSGQCNDLQAHAPLTRRVLRWPGEAVLLGAERTLDARSLRLRHDAATGLLELFDADGVPISLIYLGATFPSPIWGVRYALSILTQPYLLSRPDFSPPPGRAASGITFEPRRTDGALVLRRATWWVPTEYLKREWFCGNEAERLVRVKRDCVRHGIPDIVYAQRYFAPERRTLIPQDVLDANRKPIWLDLRNPFWLVMLERVAEDIDWVFLSEPLPACQDLWFEIDGRPHVSELQLEMLVRANPEADKPSLGARWS